MAIQQYNIKQYNIFHCSSADNLYVIENEEDEESPVEESTTNTNEYQPQTSEVIEEALNARSHKRSTISAAQTRCLDMQEKQHTMEMEILQVKKNNLVEEHQKRMEVLEAELQYWTSSKKKHG
jgi:hypothetical protein